MKTYFPLLCLLLLVGCTSLKKGEVRDVGCRVLGLDASIPIPFLQTANIMNIRIGWVETTYLHSYNVDKHSSTKQEVNHLGNVNRETTFKTNQ